ncbi:MAG: hypothetical protein ACJAT2_002598 [Bacteriovoracaceae bacterium]|jgi:hypothetical protein
MRFYLILISLCLFSSYSFGQEFEDVCTENEKGSARVSLFHCGQSEMPKSIKKLMGLNEVIGKKHCMQYTMEAKKKNNRDSELELLIYDSKRKSSRSLKCYCQDKLGKGLCSNKDKFDKKLAKLTNPFRVKAWGNFLKELFEKSSHGGKICLKIVEESLNDSSCFENLEKLHQSSILTLPFIGNDKKFLGSKGLKQLFHNLNKNLETEKGRVLEPVSSYFKTMATNRFLKRHVDGKIESIMGLKSTLYERKIKELGLDIHLDDFRKVITSDSPEEALRQKFKGGIDFFQVAKDQSNEDLDPKIVLGSHPDLKWLFTGIDSFNDSDRKKQKGKFNKFSAIAKDNPFLSFKELRQKYEETEGPNCEELVQMASNICEMKGGQNLSIAKSLTLNGNFHDVLGFVTEDMSMEKNREITLVKEEISCFQLPSNFEYKTTLFSELVERNIDRKDGTDRGVNISEVESEVDSAINQVEGFERIAERIGKEKIEANNSEGPEKSEKVEALEEDFKGFLSNLKLPNGRNFSYPEGMDPAQAVANYKSEVYKWADDAVEKRISDIQGETDRIVNSDLPPLAKKKKLKELLNEVERLNKGEFLEEIYREKKNIGEYIARYEDKKRDWESQYGAEARENPKAVQAVAPPREKTRSIGRGGSNSYKNVAGNTSSYVGSGNDSAPSSSLADNATAYIPPAPSVPFAQGSLMTRIVPKDEFQNNTVKASLLAKHKGYPIAVLDEKSQQVELYTPKGGTSYKLQETLTISEAEARGYVFPEDVKKLVESYKKDKSKGRAPSSFDEYEPTKKELLEKKKKLEKLQSLSDVMERQGVPRRARVVRLNSLLDNL